MRRGTTATHTITTGVDLSEARVFITYMQGATTRLDIDNNDSRVTVTAQAITINLTQEDTLSFTAGATVQVQVRFVTQAGVAGASGYMTLNVDDILKDGEIYYSDPTVSISGDSTVAVNASVTLTATTVPSGLDVIWTSDDETVAEVIDGVVNGVEAGETTIRATLVGYPSISASHAITVTGGEQQGDDEQNG